MVACSAPSGGLPAPGLAAHPLLLGESALHRPQHSSLRPAPPAHHTSLQQRSLHHQTLSAARSPASDHSAVHCHHKPSPLHQHNKNRRQAKFQRTTNSDTEKQKGSSRKQEIDQQ